MKKVTGKKINIDNLILFILFSMPILIICAIPFVCEPMDFSIDMFTRDTNAILGAHPFVGLVSNIGIISWTATAAISMFGGIILFFNQEKKDKSVFLIFSSFITLLLMLDDFFQLHEVIYKSYFGICETAVFMVYIILILIDLIVFRKVILKTEFLLLLSAFIFFGLSLLVDYFQSDINEYLSSGFRILLEDGFKLLGITGWLCYFSRFSYYELRKFIIKT